MSALYRPVLIESAEQAEALPEGTVVVDQTRQVAEVKGDYGWTDEYPHDGTRDADLVGWTALVPIEAKEEKTRAEPFADGTVHVGPQHWRDEPSHRLVTPWTPTEEA